MAGCSRVYIDGSFVTVKREPGDYDACWDIDGVNVEALGSVFLDFFERQNGAEIRLPEYQAGFTGSCVVRDSSIERSESRLVDLPAFSLRGIQRCPEPQLSSAKLLCDLAKSVLHIVATQTQCGAGTGDTSQRHVDMGMRGVGMGHGHPFKRATEILLDAAHDIPGEAQWIDAIAKLGRDDNFPKQIIVLPLPVLKSLRYLHVGLAR